MDKESVCRAHGTGYESAIAQIELALIHQLFCVDIRLVKTCRVVTFNNLLYQLCTDSPVSSKVSKTWECPSKISQHFK